MHYKNSYGYIHITGGEYTTDAVIVFRVISWD